MSKMEWGIFLQEFGIYVIVGGAGELKYESI